MDHRYIEEHNIVDRYLMGKLPAEDRARFEEHFIDCEDCLDRLELTEDFRHALQTVAAEEAARPSPYLQAIFLGWLARLSRWQQAVVIVSALILLVILPMAFFIREIQRAHHELDQAKHASARMQRQYEDAQQGTGALEKELQEVEQKLAEQRRQLEAQLQREQQACASLTDELTRLTRPQANTPIFVLTAVRSGEPNPSEPPNKIVVSSSLARIVFSLEVDDVAAYETYRATISTADDRLIWRERGLRPSHEDLLVISFHSTFFQARDYLLTLEGLTQEGRFVPVAHYPFRVIKR